MSIIRENCRYLNATDVSIVMLLRIMTRNPAARAFLRKNSKEYSWILTYIELRRDSKPFNGSVQNKGKVSVKSVAVANVVPREVMEKHIVIARMVFSDRKDLQHDYDSDDEPGSIIGRRVSFRWSDSNWWEGVVQSYDAETAMHRIVYDDGDVKDYSMFTKLFRMLPPCV